MKVFLWKKILVPAFAVALLLPVGLLWAEEASDIQPWEKFGVNMGVFLSAVDSSFTIGSGVSLSVDVEDTLDLDATNTVFRAEALWRFSNNRRHRLDLSWFAFRRDGNREIGEDITIEDKDGNQITIPAGTAVDAHLDLDIYELSYSYSFLQDDRIDIAAGLGFYVMPIDFGLSATGLVDEEGSQSFTAPLPVFGLRMDVALTPKWFIRTGTQVFYVEYENFTGSILQFNAALEYNPWRHFGLGVGFDTMNISLDAEDEDYPEIDFRGNVTLKYTGLQFYLRYFF